MWICLDCQTIFENPKHYMDKCGLDTPPYYHYDGCPKCGGAYAEAFECDICHEVIIDDYIKTVDNKRFCQECYMPMTLGEE